MQYKNGFSLVELMVVVSIIGILAAVGIPKFRAYQAQAKTAEAKINLSSSYIAQTVFYADHDTFHNCLRYQGYNPEKEKASRYYAIGFSSLVTSGSSSEAGSPSNIVSGLGVDTSSSGCLAGNSQEGIGYFSAGRVISGSTAANDSDLQTSSIPSSLTTKQFVIIAVGYIHPSSGVSEFSIDEKKRISRGNIGY